MIHHSPQKNGLTDNANDPAIPSTSRLQSSKTSYLHSIISGESVTMEQMYALYLKSHEIQIKRHDHTNQNISIINETMNARISQIEANQNKINIETHREIQTIKQTVSNYFKAIKEDSSETRDMMRRMNNLILMGVPETQEGLKLVAELIQLILPDKTTFIRDTRVGPIVKNQSHPSSLRIHLDNYGDKYAALKTCKKHLKVLKNLRAFQCGMTSQFLNKRSIKLHGWPKDDLQFSLDLKKWEKTSIMDI